MATSDHILSTLGLAQRAGKLINGEKRILETVSSTQTGLIFLAKDAGDNIKKKIRDKAHTYQIPVIETYDSDTLSSAIGKTNRMVLAVIDKGFVRLLKH